MSTSSQRTPFYELGRARGACYGRTEPTEADRDWLADLTDEPPAEMMERALSDFADGMLDGAEQAHCARIGLAGTAPPSAEAIAAARDA